MSQAKGSQNSFTQLTVLITDRSQMRCVRPGQGDGRIGVTEPCERCKHNNRQCIIPERRPLGRKHGAVGRYRGVEKAIRNMQAELRKARPSVDSSLNVPGLSEFTDGGTYIREFLMPQDATQRGLASPKDAHRAEEGHQIDASQMASRRSESLPENLGMEDPSQEGSESSQHDDPISNPLGLVADASGRAIAQETQSLGTPASSTSASNFDTSQTSSIGELENHSLARNLLQRPGYVSLGLMLSRESLEFGLDTLFTHASQPCKYSDYFKPVDANRPQDTGPDLDPVDLGLVSMEDAHFLFPM
jgi:hypothetical protein